MVVDRAPSGTPACGTSETRTPGSRTDRASITKIPPSRISRTSVLVMTASPAIAPPRPSEPVSPMKMLAGKLLNHRKPMHAPTRHDGQQGQIVLAAGDERDPDVGEQHDRRASGGQPVEAVGEVDRAGRARHDQVDEDGYSGRDRRSRRRSAAGRVDGDARLWRATHHSPTEIAIVTTSFVRARSPSERRLTIFV